MDRYGDFQCDLTEGFPTCLVVDYDKKEFGIELNFLYDRDEQELKCYQDICKSFGKRKFYDIEDLCDKIKRHFGDEAYENCAYSIMREWDIIDDEGEIL